MQAANQGRDRLVVSEFRQSRQQAVLRFKALVIALLKAQRRQPVASIRVAALIEHMVLRLKLGLVSLNLPLARSFSGFVAPCVFFV